MVEKRVAEKTEEFLEKAYRVAHGTNEPSLGMWHSEVRLACTGPQGGSSPKMRIVEKGATFPVAKHALRLAGVEFGVEPTPMPYHYDRPGGKTLVIDTKAQDLLAKLDRAIERLPEGRTEYVWDSIAQSAIYCIEKGFTDKTAKGSPARQLSFTSALHDEVIEAFLDALRGQLKQDFKVPGGLVAQSKEQGIRDQRIMETVAEISKYVKSAIIGNNRRSPDFPMDEPDGKRIETFCESIAANLQKKLAAVRAEIACYGPGKPDGRSR